MADAKKVAENYLNSLGISIDGRILFGLPEVDDRFHIWRVPVKAANSRIGEVVIDAKTGGVDLSKTTKSDLLTARLNGAGPTKPRKTRSKSPPPIKSSLARSVVIRGNAVTELQRLPKESVNLVFTSPPYYNAKPEYSEYANYDEYLVLIRNVIRECRQVLSEGRFFVINVSPVLLRRASRSEASKRIAVPFDFHRLFIEEGFEFVDDIHWVKPEGAGWSFGRGRRFAADRNPLQYKPVPVTEYVLVYRKATDKLIDWNIRHHHSAEDVAVSKVPDGYERTNLWRINPSRSRIHPATFPVELAEKVITYYSFRNDFVLDPFAGTGTTARAATNLGRNFVMVEIESSYVEHMKEWMAAAPDIDIAKLEFINTQKPSSVMQSFDF